MIGLIGSYLLGKGRGEARARRDRPRPPRHRRVPVGPTPPAPPGARAMGCLGLFIAYFILAAIGYAITGHGASALLFVGLAAIAVVVASRVRARVAADRQSSGGEHG